MKLQIEKMYRRHVNMLSIAIVTTAAPPWRTGTAVNPSIRAAYLQKMGFNVCISFPWVPAVEQRKLYGRTFASKAEHASFIKEWVKKNSGFQFEGMVVFYDASYEQDIGCILQRACVDIITTIPSGFRDVALLEEPEHLNWIHTGASWREHFRYVLGIVHTNYVHYAENREGWLRGQLTKLWGKFLCESHTDEIIHISPATLASEIPGVVCHVNGVRSLFLKHQHDPNAHVIYFLGKALWSKGYRNLTDLCERNEWFPGMSTFGSGPDVEEIVSHIQTRNLPIQHHDERPHVPAPFAPYKTFFNPSTSEVLCTATGEALAMGKFVILPKHSSNEYYYMFQNCLVYQTDDELHQCFQRAQSTSPRPLLSWEQRRLSWASATVRLLQHMLKTRNTLTIRQMIMQKACSTTRWMLTPRPINNILRHSIGARVEALTFRDKSFIACITSIMVIVLCSLYSSTRTCKKMNQ